MNLGHVDCLFFMTMLETFSYAPDSQISKRVTDLLKQAIETDMSSEQMYNIFEWIAIYSCCETSKFAKDAAIIMLMDAQ